ncbi:MAG: hypothetical protein EOP07_24880 [Proteobacteria bacterium]|nr:MAG: hypothetical protein EOP07_24880 [Pseudomonadota bacterium]
MAVLPILTRALVPFKERKNPTELSPLSKRYIPLPAGPIGPSPPVAPAAPVLPVAPAAPVAPVGPFRSITCQPSAEQN